jgi:hypothetical protein
MKCLAPAALFAVLLAAAPLPAPALTLSEVTFEPGLLVLGNTGESDSTGPTPVVLVQSVGVSFPMSLSGRFFFEPGAILLGTWYEYSDAGARIVPGAAEANTFFVLGAALAARAGVVLPVSKSVTLGASAGLDLLVRFPLDLESGAAGRAADMLASWAYFYGMARFLYPETTLFCKWMLTESFGLAFTARALHPVFHLWDGEGLSYLDQLIVVGQLGFTWRFRPQPADAAVR